jgi:hypothetical protein
MVKRIQGGRFQQRKKKKKREILMLLVPEKLHKIKINLGDRIFEP